MSREMGWRRGEAQLRIQEVAPASTGASHGAAVGLRARVYGPCPRSPLPFTIPGKAWTVRLRALAKSKVGAHRARSVTTSEGAVERLLQTHRFGPHRIDVIEHVDDDGIRYLVLVDGVVVTDPPLEAPPRMEDVMRIYARSQDQG